jgi:hypothetical protein
MPGKCHHGLVVHAAISRARSKQRESLSVEFPIYARERTLCRVGELMQIDCKERKRDQLEHSSDVSHERSRVRGNYGDVFFVVNATFHLLLKKHV